MSEVRCRYCGRRGHGDPCAVCADAGEMYPQGSYDNAKAPAAPEAPKAKKEKKGKKR